MSRNSQYGDEKVICPFYKYTKGLVIHCLNDYSYEFSDKKKTEEWKQEHCQKFKSNCIIRKKLNKEADRK